MWMRGSISGLLILGLLVPVASAGRWWDDFEDDNLHGWDIYNFEPRVEKWSIKRGEAIGEIFEPGSMSLLVAGDASWEDYTVRCRAKFDKVRDGEGSLGISLYESADGADRYAFFLDMGAGVMAIRRVRDRDWGFPVATVFEVERDVWYSLGASVSGDLLTFRVDDLAILAVSRTEPLPPGPFALVVSDARAHFDDIVVEGDSVPDRGPSGFAVTRDERQLPLRWADLKRIRP